MSADMGIQVVASSVGGRPAVQRVFSRRLSPETGESTGMSDVGSSTIFKLPL